MRAKSARPAGTTRSTSDLATSIGLSEEALARLMSDIGFTKAGDAWRWRGRRGHRPDRAPSRGHAFAELAKLKKT